MIYWKCWGLRDFKEGRAVLLEFFVNGEAYARKQN